MSQHTRTLAWTGVALLGLLATTTRADEAAIRKTLAARMPSMPTIDEVRPTVVPGLYELRLGTQVLYADANGQHLIHGPLFDTQTKSDLTKLRVDQLTAFNFKALPLGDALAIREGNGKRKLAIFADPNCGYCKRLEVELKSLKDVTIYLFPLAILGEDSMIKARSIWCAGNPAATWSAWMLQSAAPPPAPAACDTAALLRNQVMAEKHLITGTPTLVFEDSSRASGVLTAAGLEQRLVRATQAH